MPGGVVADLSPANASLLADRVPGFPKVLLERALANYRWAMADRTTTAQTRDQIEAIATAAQSLSVALGAAGEEAIETLWRECFAFGDARMIDRVQHDMYRLPTLARYATDAAAGNLATGRDREPLAGIIHELADAIESNAKPLGDLDDRALRRALRRLMDVALRELGLATSDIAKPVARALDARRRTQSPRINRNMS